MTASKSIEPNKPTLSGQTTCSELPDGGSSSFAASFPEAAVRDHRRTAISRR
jgi:hypothetical protein